MEEQLSTPVLQQGAHDASAHDIGQSFRSRDIVSIACLMISGAALLDAVIETSFLSSAAMVLRASVALLALLFFVLLGALWSRTKWETKALASVLFFLVLAGIAAWLPGGLDNGLRIARQPTSSVLEAISGLAVLTASISFSRLRIQLWLRLVGVSLAAYGLTAFVLALLTHQSFASLFHGQSFWIRMPFWLQGAFIAVALILLVILRNVIAVLLGRRNTPSPRWRWQVDLSLAFVALIAGAGFAAHPTSAVNWRSTGGNGPGSIIDFVQHTVSGGEVTDFNVALDENGGAIESASGIWHSGSADTVPPWDVPSQFCGGGLNGRRLIDGRTEPSWTGDPLNDPNNPPHPHVVPGIPFEIVLSFYRHQVALVGAVVITPGKELARAPKDVEIWASNASATDGFQKVGSGTLAADADSHRVTFPSAEVRYLKLRVLSNQQGGTDSLTGKPTLEIAEIQVLEARRNGYVSIRDRNPDLANWKGSPRYAAQHGIEWLQPAAIGWGLNQRCFGCHIQSQAAMGLAIAAKNDYIVSHKCAKDLADFTTSKQQKDGSYERADEGSTQFAAMGLSYWDDLESVKQNSALLKSVDYLVAKQKETGDMPYGSLACGGLTVLQGPMMATANSLVGFTRAYAETHDVRYKEAADRALAWIIAAKPMTTQDNVFKILALTKFGSPDQKAIVQEIVESLILRQTPGGGWSECIDERTGTNAPLDSGFTWFQEPNPFSTGQVLYAFKQAGVSINSSSFIKGVKYLLATQEPDGSWKADQRKMHTMGASYAPTMWAIIGLAGSFGQITTGGLQIVAESDPVKAAAARNLEIILDVSGSMNSKLGNSTRIGTARDVLRDLLGKIPDDFNVGLRVYAHRYSWKDKQHSCTDTELLVPIQKLDRQRILSTVANLKPRGDTPLVYSVWQTPADLKPVGGGSVLVITDGQETCQTNVDPAKAAEQLTAAGIPVTLNIVGFTLQGKEKRDAEQLMRPFAEATGGHYYYAENGEALARALSLAALNKFPYEVLDSSGQQVAKGQAGPLSEALQPGEYKVVVHAGEQELTEKVTVTAKVDTVLKVLRKGEQFVLEQQQGQAAEPQKAASTSGQ